jgi:cysteine synthase/rhodanese-related sulfurtransferase
MSDPSLRVYESLLDMMSSADNPTPLVRLNKVVPFRYAKVYAKLEWYNPFGAVKDRVAYNLLRDAEERGLDLSHLVEPTSGNTGMALALLSNLRGYHFSATISSAIPLEKRSALRLFGTELVELEDALCPMPGAPEGAMAKADELARQPGWHELNQYKNEANPEAHFRTTGPEIWRQTDGKITHFVAALGTCGTITGTGRFLKSQRPEVKVIGVHPTDGHDIPGVRSRRALALTDFFHPEEYDGILEIGDSEAYALNKRLFLEESLIAGPSSALALAGALKAVPDESGVVVVVIFPDNAFKYISSYRRHLPELFGSLAGAGGGSDSPPAAKAAAADPFGEQLKAAVGLAEASPDIVSPKEALELHQKGSLIVDVREPGEHAQIRVAGATLIPLGKLAQGSLDGLSEDRSTPILTLCAKGKRSIYGLLLLKAQGYTNVKSIKGGMGAWVQEGLPTESN